MMVCVPGGLDLLQKPQRSQNPQQNLQVFASILQSWCWHPLVGSVLQKEQNALWLFFSLGEVSVSAEEVVAVCRNFSPEP
jgi:hypothetical protein